jgi:hypothetical protein
MRWRSFLPALSGVVFLAVLTLGPCAPAQDGPDIFVTPIPNAPFSAVVNVERSMVRRNGSVDLLKTIREIGRDSRGRIHNEARELLKASSNKTPQLLRIHLYDPQTRSSTQIIPGKKIFWNITVNHPPATVPPNLVYSSPPGSSAPQNDFTKEDDLGVRDIDGVSTHGVRETQTIPPDFSGTGKEIQIIDEYWYSEDLRINLIVKHSDPRTGTLTLTVGQITRAEPDPALFEIPEGYKQVPVVMERPDW